MNWLADDDMLPGRLPNARIMAFGYDSIWFGQDPIKVSVSNIATRLLSTLQSVRKVGGLRIPQLALSNTALQDSFERPLVFVAHCFGGLVVEKVCDEF